MSSPYDNNSPVEGEPVRGVLVQRDHAAFREMNRLRRQWERRSRSGKVAAIERLGNRCLRCGSESNLQLDHVISLRDGGTNVESNLQVLCGLCNQRKGGRSFDYRTLPA